MEFSQTQWMLLLTEWAFGFTIYCYYHIFYERELCKNKKIEIASYIVFMIINAASFLYVENALFQLASTVLCVFLLSYNYISTFQKRIFVTMIITSLSCLAEFIAVFSVMGLTNFAYVLEEEQGILAAAFVRISEYIMVPVISKLKNLKKGADVPFTYRMIMILIPTMSIGSMIYLTFRWQKQDSIVFMAIMLLEIDFLTFFLYDRFILLREKNEEALVYELEKDSYRKQLTIMQEYMNNTKMLRHDAKNHVYIVQSLLEQDNAEVALKYIREVTKTMESVTATVHTGNIELDSLLNFKLSQAECRHIKVDCQIQVPGEMNIRAFDLATIIGNLMDNAMEALEEIPEDKREMKLDIRYSKGRLLIYAQNPYEGEIVMEKKLPKTSKEDTDKHGLGLAGIRKTVDNYQGEMFIQTENNQFCVNIMLYTNQS